MKISEEKKIDFIKFCLKEGILRFGKFYLKSGRLSPYFFNTGLFSNGNAILTLSRIYTHFIIKNKIEFSIIFGPAYKAIPIVSCISLILMNDFNINKSFCFNRKEKKKYGEKGLLIGSSLKGKILLIDDVFTSGKSIKESFKYMNNKESKLDSVLVCLDRNENSKKIITKNNINFNSLINIKDILRYIKNKKIYRKNFFEINDYLRRYGKDYCNE